MRLAELLPDFLLPAGSAGFEIKGVTDDPWEVKSDFIFCAPPETNGPRDWQHAVKRGARVLIVGNGNSGQKTDFAEPSEGKVLILGHSDVRSVHRKLLARLNQKKAPVLVAVTEGHPKSPTATFIRMLWEALGHRTQAFLSIPPVSDGLGSNRPTALANAVVKPMRALLLSNLVEGARHAVLGVSSRFDLDLISGRPLSVVVAVNLANLQKEGDAEWVSTALLLAQELTPGGAAIVSVDHSASAAIAAAVCARRSQIFTLSTRGVSADLMLLSHEVNKRGGQAIIASLLGQTHQIEITSPEGIDAESVLAAIGAVIAGGADIDLTARAATHLGPVLNPRFLE